MNYLPSFVFVLLLGWLTACTNNPSTKPEKYLNKEQQTELLTQIVRYNAKPPKRVTHEQKFDSRYDEYYAEQLTRFKLEHLYIDPKTKQYYFVVSRPAPSFKVKRVATGGILSLDTNGKIMAYEEVFRTFKMEEPELAKKAKTLFLELLNTGNVDKYMPENTTEEFIEFPDRNNVFDKEKKHWVTVTQ
ncbi:hypothetical protein [Eisenibacter elegans]|uniref:hypothetical protein n=1 Tax=Eisenibacter elegans TaxID=997 RepID=UPI0012B6720E|nr:hypothetical protein [Eisenibacter elegans]